MKKEILKGVGLNASKDVPATVLESIRKGIIEPQSWGMHPNDVMLLKNIETYNEEYIKELLPKGKALNSTIEAVKLLRPLFENKTSETFYIICLNTAMNVQAIREISDGVPHRVLVDKRKLVQVLLEHNATAAIISHNHPSGNLKPSESDIHFTEALENILTPLDIKLCDHIVISPKGYYSIKKKQEVVYEQF